jgi:hypothetical protein
MERKDKFINGVFFNKPRQNWITANISIKYPQIIQEIKRLEKFANKEGFVNLDCKTSKEGKYYWELNNFQPKEVTQKEHSPDVDLPF